MAHNSFAAAGEMHMPTLECVGNRGRYSRADEFFVPYNIFCEQHEQTSAGARRFQPSTSPALDTAYLYTTLPMVPW